MRAASETWWRRCSEIVQVNPNIKWTDIADLQQAKRLLEVAVVLPMLISDISKASVALEGRINSWSSRHRQDDAGQGGGHGVWHHVLQCFLVHADFKVPRRE